ncbi:MAG TPA: NACHT domain-containing protein [Anaerolineae bacterium]|nr:NACHT domain-containing protein [Anaerolineae bacterium]
MQKRSNLRTRIRIIATIIVFIIVGVVTLQTEELPDNRIIAIFLIIILAIGFAEPVINVLNSILDYFANRSKIVDDVELRKAILANQNRLWIEGILNRAIENEPLNVPFEADAELMTNLQERMKSRIVSDQKSEAEIDSLSTSDHTKRGLFGLFADRLLGRQTDDENTPLSVQSPIPPKYTILDAYKTAGRQLVILGAGGSGKTIALLQLLNTLYKEAISNPAKDIPVVFNLGSWTEKERPPLQEWFVSELGDTFEELPPIKKLNELVDQRNLIFLLDGFDEVPDWARQDLFNKLQEFTNKVTHRRTQFVLCSRPKEYKTAQSKNLKSSVNTVILKHIDDNQIKHYLADESYYRIREFIFEPHSKLYEPAHRPFILNALAIGYIEPPSEDIRNLRDAFNTEEDMVGEGDLHPIPRIILQRYISQQFGKSITTRFGDDRNSASFFEEEGTNNYLTIISHKLQETQADNERNDKARTLLLENLQPAWLDNDMWRWVYSIASRMLTTTAIIMGAGFVLASPFDFLPAGMLAGAVAGVLDGLVTYTRLKKLPDQTSENLYRMIRFLAVYLCCSIVLSIPFGLSTPAPTEDLVLGGKVSLTGITLAWFLSLFIAVVYSTRDIRFQLQVDIKPVEAFKLEVGKFLKFGLIGGLLIGSFIGVFAYLLSFQESGSTALLLNNYAAVSDNVWVNPFTVGFFIGFMAGGTIVGVFGLLAIVDVEERLRPNQGIQTSLRNAIRVGLLTALIFGTVLSVGNWWYHGDVDSIYRGGIRNALALGIFAGLWYGGIDTIHHLVLRFFLFVSGLTPWRLNQFLHYSSQRNLMREIGAAYIFNHEYLRLFYATRKRPNTQLRPLPLVGALGGFVFIIGIGYIPPFIHDIIFPFNQENEFRVEGPTSTMIHSDESFQLEAGQKVTIQSRGLVRSGNFMGYVLPEGSNVGIWGMPAGDAYDIVRDLPNNALICKLDSESESEWQLCAERTSDYPFLDLFLIANPRTKIFTATTKGNLQFDINETEVEKRSGFFSAIVTVSP